MKQLAIIMTLLNLTFFSSIENAKAQESMTRKQLFDNDWKFSLGEIPSAFLESFDDTEWRLLDLPHDWSIEGKIEQKNPMSGAGGYFPAGKAWYRKTFIAPSAWEGKFISMYFEGVYRNAEVFINGKSLGVHPYGYTSFCHVLTPYLKYNQKNTIAVKVDNSEQINCRWYSGSGIYRHVWMTVTNPIHLSPWKTFITTPEVSPEKATVVVRTLIKNETDKPQNILLSTEISDITKAQVEVQLQANSEKEVTQTLLVTHPSCWTPDNPRLYKVKTSVLQGKKTLDVLENNIGIRSIHFSAEKGFELNGKPLKLNGGCMHHDNGCLGAAAYDRAEERRVELLKAGGFNAVRTSHNPPSEAFLEACDRLGMMVIDESFDGWKTSKTAFDYASIFKDWWQRDLEAMVLRDRNHPSVILWSTGNEIIERTTPEAVETAKMLAEYIREMDPTRPVTSAMTTWGQGWAIFDPLMAAHDVCGYNYQLHEATSDHQRVPSRIILQTESYPKEAFKNWNAVQTQDYVIGDFVWTAMDYLGESAIGRSYYPEEQKGEHWEHDYFPWHGAYCGDIDLTGWRKPISHYRNLLWNTTEKLYMAVKEPNPDNGVIKETLWSVWPTWESWTWPGKEGKEMEVEVYSKYPSVRLYLNGKLMEERSTLKKQEFKTTFKLPYSPGELKAVGVSNSKEMESKVLQTAGQAVKMKLTADRNKLKADGQDLSFITIEFTDKEGRIQPNPDNRLSFKVEGEGVLVGVDNANLKDPDSYVATTRKAWHGRALVVLKSSHKKGLVKLTVSTAGLPNATMTIHTLDR